MIPFQLPRIQGFVWLGAGHKSHSDREVEVRTTVVTNDQNILVRLWRIAALNNVVRLTRNNDSGHAMRGMPTTYPLAGRKVNNSL